MSFNHDHFENIIILKSLTDSQYLSAVVELLDPKFFQDKNNKTLIGIISEFYKKRGKPPTLTELKVKIVKADEIEAYKHIVNKLKSFDRNIDENELYENTEKFFRDKSIYFAILKASENLNNLDESLDEIVREMQNAVSINLSHSLGFNLRKDIDSLVTELKTVYKTISTGWKWLDDHLGGGFQEIGRALYIFCGITNIGKSIFLGQMAQAIAKQNKNVLLISLEMPEHMYVKRLCSQITKIPLSDMQKYADIIPERLMDSLRHTNGNIIVKEFPPSIITVSQLEAFIKKVIQVVQIDAIVIDYVNLLKGTFGNNSYERVKDTTEKLRALSYVFNCPIITATQLNRSAAANANPGIETISESFGLAATADCLFNIWQEEEDQEMGIIRLGIIKNRFGPRCVATALKIDYSTLSITEDSQIEESDNIDIQNTLEMLKSL